MRKENVLSSVSAEWDDSKVQSVAGQPFFLHYLSKYWGKKQAKSLEKIVAYFEF
jgi:hypothetical protein